MPYNQRLAVGKAFSPPKLADNCQPELPQVFVRPIVPMIFLFKGGWFFLAASLLLQEIVNDRVPYNKQIAWSSRVTCLNWKYSLAGG